LKEKILALYQAWKDGKLGGKFMPEDSNPGLSQDSENNYLYFTLPMALNYQRNSYKLWEGALKTFEDPETSDVFDVQSVLSMSDDVLRYKLVKYKVALQPNKQVEIWRRLCETIQSDLSGTLKKLFSICDYDVVKIKDFIQVKHKKKFPYLSGNKICNYWLYVILQYTDCPLKNKQAITVAPDTHVIQASIQLGLISGSETDLQLAAVKAWEDVLKDTHLSPIDIHTPLWLWSRSFFQSFSL